ncbi:hypothetical protein Ciccas_010107, partial [Cichlidogyrus casuarinus]
MDKQPMAKERKPPPQAPSIYYGNEMRAKLYDIDPPRPATEFVEDSMIKLRKSPITLLNAELPPLKKLSPVQVEPDPEKVEMKEIKVEEAELKSEPVTDVKEKEDEDKEKQAFDVWNNFNAFKQTSSGGTNLYVFGKGNLLPEPDKQKAKPKTKEIKKPQATRNKDYCSGDFNPQLSMTTWSYKEVEYYE